MKTRAMLLSLAIVLGTSLARAQTIEDKSYRDANGNLVLRMEMVAPVSLEENWRLWTTDEGVASWMAPVVAIDLRIGGIWEASYDPENKIGQPGNIRNEILAFLPNHMIAMRVVGFPKDYPLDVQKVSQTHTVVLFEKVDEKSVRVIVCGVGYQEGEEWEAMYRVGQRSTQSTLNQYYKRCTEGPQIEKQSEQN